MGEHLSYEQRLEVTRSVFHVFGDWEVPPRLMPELLGMEPDIKRRMFNRYRLGTPLPETGETYERALLFLDIDNALHKMFPHSQISASLWVTTPRVKFANETPLDLMLRRGLEGIRTVRAVLHNMDLW
jgi:hypothetical protein